MIPSGYRRSTPLAVDCCSDRSGHRGHKTRAPRPAGLFLLSVALAGACAGKRDAVSFDAGSVAIDAGADSGILSWHERVFGLAAISGPEPTCGGVYCELPAAYAVAVTPEGEPIAVSCCYDERACGVRFVKGPGVRPDICVPFESPGDANADCPQQYDRARGLYAYGCCLPDHVCGTLWSVTSPLFDFGCVDPRAIGNLPAEASCDPAHGCEKIGAACNKSDDCCALAPGGTVCASFGGSAAVCAQPCAQNDECPTQCCHAADSGEHICVPTAVCNACEPSAATCSDVDAG
jgi:hypothetical protein